MEESKKITLSLGTVSLEKELGCYYIDMRPAIVHYTNNIYNGRFDENGVPQVGVGNGKFEYFSINIAQYCFMLHADYLETGDTKKMEILEKCISKIEEIKVVKDDCAIWYHSHDNRYNLPSKWASAMAQGELISLYLRLYQIKHDESYLNTAIQSYNFLKKYEVKDGGARRYDDNGDLWFEEYPSNPPSYVLNGFIYTIFGLFDLYRVTGRQDVKQDIDACIKTLKNNLHKFDSGYWSNYDLLYKELVRYYYQKNVHVPQMQILYQLTGEEIFRKYAVKWEKNICGINYMFVKIMYRVRPRLQKIIKKIKKQ